VMRAISCVAAAAVQPASRGSFVSPNAKPIGGLSRDIVEFSIRGKINRNFTTFKRK